MLWGNGFARPPMRPSDETWWRWNDTQRDQYLGQLKAWLEALGMDPRWMAELETMAEWYQAYHEIGAADPNWKRGGR